MKPIEIITEHERRNHGVTRARWWPMLRKIVERTGKFPSRNAMKSFARGMYQIGERGQKLKKLRSNLGWQNIIDPKFDE